ncbi:hypothetical protein IG631_18701 [Alternaria alternata]|nr:hypothetical protein IG631_18701 [Alternaria alternata]
MRHRAAAVMSTKIAAAVWLDDAWLKIIVASLLNHFSFTHAIKTLEPIFAPFQDSQEPLGMTPSRIWSAREWQAIKIMSFSISIALTIAHIASRETEPYLLLWGCFVYLATKLVATGLSSRAPRGKWQSLSMRTADVLKEFPPFHHLLGRYKAPRWASSTLPVVESAEHIIKRNIPSNSGSEWGSSLTGAIIGAGVTLACHVHRTLLDRKQRNVNAAINEQQREEMEKLMTTLSRLAVLAERFLGPGTQVVEAHQLIAALDQQLTTSPQQLSTTSTLHGRNKNGQDLDVSGHPELSLSS